MIRLRGYSDDNVCIEGDETDEIGCYGKDVIFTIGSREASEGKDAGGVEVRMSYRGVWSARISQFDDESQIPWPISVTSERYSVVVSIECPAGTPFKARKVSRKE